MSQDMEPMENELIDQVRRIFMRLGIKSVTMDDIARELKISKKTLYKYVSDKPDLVMKVMKFECEEDSCMMDEYAKKCSNAIEELLAITQHVGKKVKEIHPSIHFDLEKYYPEAWEMFNQHKRDRIYSDVLNNMKRGMHEGLYRSDINADILTRIHISRVDIVFDGELFPPSQFNFGQVFLELMTYHIHGIASEKGLAYLKEAIKNTELSIKF
jgi:TetR/AcrR family transcriptional regulator, cholesterol catabolism regulator